MCPSEPLFDPRQRLPTLDGLRGVAILLVILSHATVIEPANTLERAVLAPASMGWCGVDLFFVLSGFLITGVLLSARDSPAYFSSFYARRALRILPLYYLLLLAVLIVLPRVPHPRVEGFAEASQHGWVYWVFLSNFKNATEGHFGHPMLAVTWSLAIEEQFYLVWPVVAWLTGARGLLWLCPVLTLGSLACRLAMLAHAEPNPVALYTLTPCRLDGLAVGSWLAALAHSGWRPQLHTRALMGLATVCYLLVLGFDMGRPLAAQTSSSGFSSFVNGPGFTLLSVAAGALLLLALCGDAAPRLKACLLNPVLRSFGRYSFAIYLLHLPARAALRDVVFGPGYHGAQPWLPFPEVGGSLLPAQLFFFLLTIALSWLLGWLSWRVVESPFLRFKRRFPYRQAAPALVAAS